MIYKIIEPIITMACIMNSLFTTAIVVSALGYLAGIATRKRGGDKMTDRELILAVIHGIRIAACNARNGNRDWNEYIDEQMADLSAKLRKEEFTSLTPENATTVE